MSEFPHALTLKVINSVTSDVINEPQTSPVGLRPVAKGPPFPDLEIFTFQLKNAKFPYFLNFLRISEDFRNCKLMPLAETAALNSNQ